MPAPRKVSGALATRSPSRGRPRAARSAGAVERERLLAPDVLARGERLRRHLDVRLGDGEVDDDLDRVVGQQLLHGAGALHAVLVGLGLARSRSMSAMKRTSRSGNAVRLSRYWLLMTPAPMRPTPTVPPAHAKTSR